ncbi:MAG: hypothetical protein QOE47_424 [Pyrinomonadaceae bacterium]|jgi:hypothetical protein|nr:hypothetical protein [Pyrinomonadaceae bacterium]
MEQSWTTRTHPEGFTLDLPADWQLSAEDGCINASGPNAERVTILPLRVEAQLDVRLARNTMLTFCYQFWPQQHWNMPQGGWQFTANSVGAVGGDASALRQTAALWWVNSGESATAFFYALAAPPAGFKSLEPVFARIVNSFRVTRAGERPDPNPLARMQFQTWTDPNEDAFSIQVPAGWRVTGGVFRPGFLSTVSEFVIQSPDGRVTARSGDVNFPSKYVVPDMNMMSLGLWEGQFTSDGRYITNYKPALDYAAHYVQNTIGRNCQNLQWLSNRDRADRVQALAWYTQALGFTMHTAAELTYSCQMNGQPYLGYQYAETAITHYSQVATLWDQQAIFGFIAAPDSVRLADAVLFRAINTFQINPQWMVRQGQMNARAAADLRSYHEHSARLWQETQEARWASWDRIAEQRGDVLRGQTQVVDPETGYAYKVQNSSSYYWLDPVNNVIAGTNLPYRPDWNFHEIFQKY